MSWVQAADGGLTAIYTVADALPITLVLLALVLRKRLDLGELDAGRIAAFFSEMILVARISLDQGSRYTHWTICAEVYRPSVHHQRQVFNAQTIANTLLLLTIVYAVFRYLQDAVGRQGALEQEFKSARELQRVLIPETLPEVPGYAVTSAYRPAQEVGGDFFQIIPLEGEHAGSTLVLARRRERQGPQGGHDRLPDCGRGAHPGQVCSPARRAAGRAEPAPPRPPAGRLRHLPGHAA